MTVDNCGKDLGQACRTDVVNRGMDDHGCQGTHHRRPPCTRRSSKSKAPPPPPAVKDLDGPPLSPTALGYQRAAMEQQQDSPLERDLTLVVVLPEGDEKTTVVHGSKPLMDLLITLCAKYHLNPSGHTIELVSTNRNHIKFKPNALIGTLEAEKILLKPKGMEEKNKKVGPQMPEATVRLVINYKKTQKTILRVSPKVPLNHLLPAICEKCEFDTTTTILLRNVQSDEPLDLTNSLHDFGIREVYARDTKAMSPTELPPSPTHSDTLCLSARKDKSQKERENKENKGLFSLFRRSRKKSDQPMTASAPASPILRKPRPVSMCALPSHTSSYSSNTMPSDGPKKRRAPLPPTMMSSDTTADQGADQEAKPQSPTQTDGHQDHPSVSRASSSESSLKRTKRKAPPPPTSTSTPTPSPSPPEEAPAERSLTGIPLQAPLEEIGEQEEESLAPTPAEEESSESAAPREESGSSPLQASSALGHTQEDDSSLNLSADISMDSEPGEASSPTHDSDMLSLSACEDTGEDQSSDLSSHGKLAGSLMSSEEYTTQMLSAEAQAAPKGEDEDSGMEPAVESSEQDASSAQEATVPDEFPGGGADPRRSPGAAGSPQHPPDTPQPQVAEEPSLDAAGSRAASALEECTRGEAISGASSPTNAPGATSKPEPQPTPPPSAELQRDTATSTEELTSPEAVSPVAVPPTPSPPSTPAPTPTLVPTGAKGGPVTEAKPKPKPSNEVTRDYIPKVGMTTYTIVPQKSLEKLRYFEVELTLEAPPVAPPEAEVVDGDAAKTHDESATAAQPADAPPAAPGADPPLRNGTEPSDSPAASPSLTSISASLPAGEAASAGRQHEEPEQAVPTEAAREAKEKKVPPATKPKPASFRLPQHKRTPGYYVTSAAVKSAGGGHKEAPAAAAAAAAGGQPREPSPQAGDEAAVERVEEVVVVEEEEEEDWLFPPPPPREPAGEVEQAGQPLASAPAEPAQKPAATSTSPSPSPSSGYPDTILTRQGSLPAKPPSPGLSLEKLRSFAAPKPYSPTLPSRFAQAVSSAVKRSHSQGPVAVGQTTRKVPLYPLAGHSPIREMTEPLKNTVTDNGEREDKCPGAQGAVTSSAGEAAGPTETQSQESATRDHSHGNGAPDTPPVSGVPPSTTLLRSSGEMQAAHEE
ncbi:cordon-bleu protein-like 1b isoform X1 [Alosa pseudoharengus]|uniref:cordon-bleu protein-like 1b isoform X1 n=2 Tax=Alosa pseudoharengus TaxID=34774 RepID=UPI003F8A0AD0